jgi:hypothetical protein
MATWGTDAALVLWSYGIVSVPVPVPAEPYGSLKNLDLP